MSQVRRPSAPGTPEGRHEASLYSNTSRRQSISIGDSFKAYHAAPDVVKLDQLPRRLQRLADKAVVTEDEPHPQAEVGAVAR
jgi:hypothetical protein